MRLALPEDPAWAADQTTILQALGVLDPAGNPTPRLEVVQQADVARLTQEDWQRERDRMSWPRSSGTTRSRCSCSPCRARD